MFVYILHAMKYSKLHTAESNIIHHSRSPPNDQLILLFPCFSYRTLTVTVMFYKVLPLVNVSFTSNDPYVCLYRLQCNITTGNFLLGFYVTCNYQITRVLDWQTGIRSAPGCSSIQVIRPLLDALLKQPAQYFIGSGKLLQVVECPKIRLPSTVCGCH